MNKNTKISIGLFMFICGIAVMSSINKREGMENEDKKRKQKCIKPTSLDSNCGQVMKNKKGLSYKACKSYCEDQEDCSDGECGKYGLIIKEDKKGNYKVESGPIDISDIDTVSNVNISKWPVIKNDSENKPYPRGHAHNGDNNDKNHYHTDDEGDDCY